MEGEGRQASEMRALAYNYEAARARDTDGIFVLQFLMFFYILAIKVAAEVPSLFGKKKQQKWIARISSSAVELREGFLKALPTGLFLPSFQRPFV